MTPSLVDVVLQVVMMGDKGVGKSCLVQRFTKGTFIDGIEVGSEGFPSCGWRAVC